MKAKANTFGWRWTNTYGQLPKRFYRIARPADFPKPQVVLFNQALAKELGIEKEVDHLPLQARADLFSGKVFPDGTRPISQAYAGHQFGHFTVLGDGRAILLGEHNSPDGKSYDIHLKGAGLTPYSRGGDGKAVLGPMLREYLISEAMHALGVPTSRSLAVTLTGESVYRTGFEQGAVLTRVASSHLRVGTFQFAYTGGLEDLKTLADYAIARHDPDIDLTQEKWPYQVFLARVIKRQADLIAKWQLLGFVHGVMNTDNMTISGETIDYGPCAFMDTYDPETVFSSIDRAGRYAYENQGSIGRWNLSRLADALLPIIDENQDLAIQLASDRLVQYGPQFQAALMGGMRQKLGLGLSHESDQDLFQNLLGLMYAHKADYTNTFVRLTLEMGQEDGGYLQGTQALFANQDFVKWKETWAQSRARSGEDQAVIYDRMQAANPFIIPRNHLVEDVLTKASQGDLKDYQAFLRALLTPYAYTPDHKKYQALPAQAEMKGYQTFCGT